MQNPKLYMLMLGGRPEGRHTEQHDIFFGVGESVKDLVPAVKAFWPEAKSNLHVDAWREVNYVNGHHVQVLPKENAHEDACENALKLFFLNLGGYKPGEFDEFHYKMLVVAPDMGAAAKQARQSAFYKHTGFQGASSHIDDKFGVDVDELLLVKDMLPNMVNEQYSIQFTPTDSNAEDQINLGYFQLHKL